MTCGLGHGHIDCMLACSHQIPFQKVLTIFLARFLEGVYGTPINPQRNLTHLGFLDRRAQQCTARPVQRGRNGALIRFPAAFPAASGNRSASSSARRAFSAASTLATGIGLAAVNSAEETGNRVMASDPGYGCM